MVHAVLGPGGHRLCAVRQPGGKSDPGRQHRRLGFLRRDARRCFWWRSFSNASAAPPFSGRRWRRRCWFCLFFCITVSQLNFGYLWYNLIGCAACVLLSLIIQAALGSNRQTHAGTACVMSSAPVICFGQQPCGFFPRRFLFAKIQTARRLQEEIGGEIVFFCHDSDHDPRETQTILRHRKTNEPAQLNFAFENRIQRKFSPLYLKRIPAGWQDKTALQLPNYVEPSADRDFQESFRRQRRRFLPGNVSRAWVCSTASAWCVRATRPFAARPATCRNFSWMCRTKAKSSAPGSLDGALASCTKAAIPT